MRTRSIAFGLLTAMAAACSDGGTGPQGPASVAISTPQSTLVADESVQLTWLVKDQQGATLANEPVVFTSSNTATATVTNGGLVTGVRPGNVSITGKAGAATGVVAIVVAEGGVVTAAGGTLSGFGGAIELVVPAGAVATATPIQLSSTTNPLLDPTGVAGSIYSVSPDAQVFALPATITVRFNPAARPVGLPVADLRLRRFDGSAWVGLAGGSVDVATNRAVATLASGGTLSVGWAVPSTPCAAPESRQFDFWLGAWSVGGANGQSFAQSDITAAVGGCAIFEHYRDNGGTVGRSISFYEPSTARWYQTYVDNLGSRTLIAGAFANGAMDLLNPPGGGQQHQLWRWTVEGNNVRQQGSLTNNGGASYGAPFFDGLYTKR